MASDPVAADLDLDAVRAALADRRPSTGGVTSAVGWQAATALVVAPGPQALEIALIERAERPGDRWSGQMALPGGKRDSEDDDLADTAIRETREEVGLQLGPPLARLDDQRGRARPGVVATYVFTLEHRPPLVPQAAEVAAAFWAPIPALFDPAATTRFRWSGIPFPAIEHEGRVIWGLTHRILQTFADAVGLSR